MCGHVQVDCKIRSELPSGPALAKLGFNLSCGDGRLMRAKKSIPYNNKIPLTLPIAMFPRRDGKKARRKETWRKTGRE